MSRKKERSVILGTAFAQIRYRKSSSILIGISILLTTALLMIIGSSVFGLIRYQKKNIELFYGSSHACFVRVEEEKYNRILASSVFETVGSREKIGETKGRENIGLLYAADANANRMTNGFPLEEGQWPLGEKEIAGPAAFFRKMGYEGVIGEEITLTYRIQGKGKYQEETFVICGLTDHQTTQKEVKKYPCLLSEAYADRAIAREDRSRVVYVRLGEEENYNAETLEQKIKQVTAELGIDERNLDVNTNYLIGVMSIGWEWIGIGTLLTLLVILFSSLVIYNIFYVGLVSRVQEFGKIRGLGAGKRQLRSMILWEGILLGGAAVPAGILLGGILTHVGFDFMIYHLISPVMVMKVVTVTTWSPVIMGLTAVISFFTIWLSLRKPMKIVARISPVEAIRHENRKEKHKTRKEETYPSVSLFRLTESNLARNKRRTLSTILTMGLSSVLFIVVANMGASISVADLARQNVEKGDFTVSMDYRISDDTYPENNLYAKQARGLLNDGFVEKVRAIPGVTNVEVRKGVSVQWEGKEEKIYDVLSTVSKEDWEKRIKRDIIDGETDYDAVAAQGGIAFTAAYWRDVMGVETGMALPMTLLHGKGERVSSDTGVLALPEKIPFRGKVLTLGNTIDSALVMDEKSFEKLGLQGNTNLTIFITCEESMRQAVEQELKEMTASEESYVVKSYQEAFRISEMTLMITVVPLYGLMMTLGLIGFMNMANTLITSIITRKQELGVLQAIGLSNRQLVRMLQMEGLVFTIGTLVLSLTLGNGLGYAAYLWMKKEHIMAVLHYHFPYRETMFFVGGLVLLQLILSYTCSRYLRKDSVIERIRYPE